MSTVFSKIFINFLKNLSVRFRLLGGKRAKICKNFPGFSRKSKKKAFRGPGFDCGLISLYVDMVFFSILKIMKKCF
jgi:hypothetical protein